MPLPCWRISEKLNRRVCVTPVHRFWKQSEYILVSSIYFIYTNSLAMPFCNITMRQMKQDTL
jgi:hypothetical protein